MAILTTKFKQDFGNNASIPRLNNDKVSLILYADDVVIFSTK